MRGVVVPPPDNPRVFFGYGQDFLNWDAGSQAIYGSFPEWEITRNRGYLCLAALLVIALLLAGCTTTPGTQTTMPTAAPSVSGTSGASPGPAGSTAMQTQTPTKSAGLDTTIDVHRNDFACIDVTAGMGVDYLYPDQKFQIQVAPPANQVNVNILFLDVTDNAKLLSVSPVWNEVNKVWTDAEIVPIVQFNDLAKTQTKTITIKNQGKYFLCADDRKETGGSDAVYHVPVKFTPVT